MQPTGEDPDPQLPVASSDAAASSDTAAPRHTTRRLIIALTVYAALAVAAGFRLSGRPRLMVWLFLGLFVFKTLLLVPRQKTD